MVANAPRERGPDLHRRRAALAPAARSAAFEGIPVWAAADGPASGLGPLAA
jgi:hypothetical protein